MGEKTDSEKALRAWQKSWSLVVILIGALALRAALLTWDVVPFDADEAIVALMACHILRGEHPLFFYGQHYMGSLDAYLIAGAFALMGESVLAVRIVQMILFVGTMLASYAVTLRLADRQTALWVTWLLAFPPVLLTLYTAVSLGGYGETMLAGSLLLWWAHRLGHEDAERWTLWLGWGLVAGLGFWVLGLVMVYAAPVAVWLLWRLRARAWRGYLLAALGFGVGSLPWWLGRGYLSVMEIWDAAFRGAGPAGGFLSSVGARLFNLIFLGIPALLGLRFPWNITGPPLWLAMPALVLYLGALIYGLRRRGEGIACSDRLMLCGICGMLCLGFVLTSFGADPSGRYFLPLYLPLFVFTADILMMLRRRMRQWVWVVLAAVLAFNLAGTFQAALAYPPGITAHFNPVAQVDHRYDEALIRFLRAHGGRRGYANYWVAYPIAFLSGEDVILAPRLPYKASLRYSPYDNRYAPYDALVEASPTVVYVTTDYAGLNAMMREQFVALGVHFREVQIGSYHVFYDLSRRVSPDELAIQTDDG
jgi:4-amino-4-deoxy-L-arabinose transferase-like glycosyltransferase